LDFIERLGNFFGIVHFQTFKKCDFFFRATKIGNNIPAVNTRPTGGLIYPHKSLPNKQGFAEISFFDNRAMRKPKRVPVRNRPIAGPAAAAH
jgi:hypothetical protein